MKYSCDYIHRVSIALVLLAITSTNTYCQSTFVDFRIGAGDFHFNEIVEELQNGSTLQEATYKKFSNTPNLGGDFTYRTYGGFVISFGGNYGNSSFLPYGKQDVELKSLVNNVVRDTAKVKGAETYGRAKLGIGFSGDPESSVFAGFNISGEMGWGSSIYFGELFKAYNPTTGYIDPALVQVVPTTWAGVYANLFINFNITPEDAPQSQFFGFSMTFPRVWRNGELQKGLTPGLFLQYGFVF